MAEISWRFKKNKQTHVDNDGRNRYKEREEMGKVICQFLHWDYSLVLGFAELSTAMDILQF